MSIKYLLLKHEYKLFKLLQTEEGRDIYQQLMKPSSN